MRFLPPKESSIDLHPVDSNGTMLKVSSLLGDFTVILVMWCAIIGIFR